ncbi:MAG: NAD(P)H-dependent flavin oxidoreductase [Panacagrimonas sp.]
MSVPAQLQNLRLPVICSPMFIASHPKLVIEQCKAGFVGSFPALNARPAAQLAEWLDEITGTLATFSKANPGRPVGPLAVNQIIHHTNNRLDHDLRVCIEHRVPLIISSLRAPNEIIPDVHSYGGLVFHDVINVRHAEKALEAGVDGLILVCAGAGGHAGTLSPFALLGEVRKFFQGPVALAGAIANGSGVLAAQAMGADFAYIGTRWLATPEANVSDRYRDMLVAAAAKDIVYTPYFSGVHGNYLRASIQAVGMDPEKLPEQRNKMEFGETEAGETIKAWRDVWSAGQGVAQIDQVMPVAGIADQLEREYCEARARLG